MQEVLRLCMCMQNYSRACEISGWLREEGVYMGLGGMGQGQICVWVWVNPLTIRRPGRGGAGWGKLFKNQFNHWTM
jgi:hypothetical protein